MSEAKLKNLHHRAILVDGHADTFSKITANGADFFKRTPVPRAFPSDDKMPGPKMRARFNHRRHLDFPRMVQGGVDLQFMAIYTPPRYQAVEATFYALKMLVTIKETVKLGPDKLVLVKSSRDIKEVQSGKKGFLVNIEDGSPLDGKLHLLDLFYGLGVRSLGLTHNPRNEISDGIHVKHPRGLTPFGRQVVRRLEELGMLIDVAHLARPGFYDVLRQSHGPIISSHTGVRALCDIPRNLDDDQIKQVARRRGVVGIFYLPEYITKAKRTVTVSDVVNHIQYVADKFGVDYVGLGSDFDGYQGVTKGLEDATRVVNITAELVKRGFNQGEITKILGGNFLRVLRNVLH